MSVILNIYNKVARKFEDKTLLEKNDIESGEGYIKFPDGTMIQRARVSSVKTDTSANGYTIVKFKENFIDSNYQISIANAYTYTNQIFYNVSDVRPGQIHVYYSKNSGGYNVGESVDFHLMAIGRWK